MENISATDVILFPAILLFFGAFVYGAAYAKGLRDHALPRYRWVGTSLFVLAAIIGVRFVYRMVEPEIGVFYRATLQGRKVVAAHYAALVIPLLFLAAIVGLEAYFRRFSRDMA